MYPTYPCPNPVCTHAFSPDAVKGASSLVCPKCGTIFWFGLSATAPPLPANSGKPPAPPKPPPPGPKAVVAPPPPPRPASPLPSAPPLSAGNVPAAPPNSAEPSTAALDFDSAPEMVVPRARRKPAAKGGNVSWPVFLILSVLGPTVSVWGGLWLFRYVRSNLTEQESARVADVYNSRFSWPDKPWTRSRDIELRLHVHVGMIAQARNAGMGLSFKDYKSRLPSDAEMIDDALAKLRSYFQGLEWELKPKDKSARLASQPAQVIEFQGVDADEVTMNGECAMVAFRGYGYWFFTWAPLGDVEVNRESIRAEWARLRGRLSLLDGRKGWTVKPRDSEKIAGKKATYYLSYVKELWTHEPAEDYDDPQADLVLKGHEPDPERKPLAGKDATVQVLVLPKQASLKAAAAAARDYVKQREMKLYERTTLEPIKDKHGAEVDRAADIGAQQGYLSKLHMKNTEDLERYLLIAVVNRPEGVIAVVGECLWERRDFWDQEIMAMLKTFKVKD
ncbi:MAG TPA: hypothetical protein VMG10_37015 [Gemmataceae bacterium]|nr:hypothetical protein [Gemmataceae bacterium]